MNLELFSIIFFSVLKTAQGQSENNAPVLYIRGEGVLADIDIPENTPTGM